jgi:peptidoglycan/LPS O-acetylase OafA/YrhL
MYFPLFHLASFLVGVATCEYYLKWIPIGYRRMLVPGVTLCMLLVCLNWIREAPGIIRQAANISFMAFPFAAVILSVACLPANLTGALDKTWIRMMGRIAFPIYLLQVPVYKVFDRLILKSHGNEMSIPLFISYLGVLLALSTVWISWTEPVIHKWLTWNNEARRCKD